MAGLLVRRHGAVGTVVLSNVERHNAMTYDMWSSLPDTLAALDADPAVRVLVLAGDGERAFVSGSDISQFEQQRTGAEASQRYNRAVEQAHLAAGRCNKPVIAKIRGICIGGGIGLAASCDVRLCADDARFRIPAARIGLGYPTAGIARLLPLLGPQRTLDILLSARYFDAEEALRIGLVAHVWPAAEFDAKCDEWLSMVADNAPLTLQAVKRAVNERVEHPGRPPSDEVESLVAACFASHDYREGTRAFAERRAPLFEGR